jgi:hypothetical protein
MTDVKRAVVLLALGASCTDDTVVEVGIIEYYNDPLRVQVVPPLTRGVPFVVNVLTYGSRCTSVEATDVEIEGDLATITPYDRRHLGGCVAVLVQLGHPAEITFDTPGMKAIRVIGRKLTSGPEMDELVGHELLVRVD